MNDKEIIWHYNEFLEIQYLVQEKLREMDLDPTNPIHQQQIQEIIKECVLKFKREF